MSKDNKFCQSCGMPHHKDTGGGGTEADGSKCAKYCSYCYKEGAFQMPELDNAQKMQEMCMVKMRENGMGKIASWLFTRNIPNLERWKNKA